MEHRSSINIPVPNETQSFTTRTTREGKTLRYELKVLQQPVRARACGSGSKSSADRRPVDPPPIVQLRVLEVKPNVTGEDTSEDITFMMNANYFLFATLEPARHMAQPRGMPDPNKPTVLTGTPVAGMVYLDRPDPAGYFIFPDLSVRHEGHFRLSFSLYEELKRVEDHDKVDDPSRAVSPGDNHVTHRLEVKSAVLQVYSAKKFPGLTESTALSRTVAEQGCRVRIRRDVRMRRAGPSKSGKDWDGYEDRTADHRAEMERTPEVSSYAQQPHYPVTAPPPVLEPTARPRSASNGSHHSLAASLSRRQSQQELAQLHQQQQQHQQQQYHQQQQQRYGGTAPQTPQSGIAPPSAYGPPPVQQFSQPTYMQQPPPPPQPQQQPMQPPPAQYQSHAYPPAPIAPQQSGHYNYQPAPTYQHQYAPPPETNGHSHRASGDWSVKSEYRRPSAPPVPQQGPAPYSHPYQQAPAPYQTQAPHQPNYYAPIEAKSTRAPPPEPIQPPTRTTAPTPPLSAKPYSFTLPPISHALEPASPAVHTPNSTNSFFPNSFASQASGSDSHKRSYGSTFSTVHHDIAQKAGARPDTYPQPPTTSLYSEFDVDNDDDEDDEDAVRRFMQSRRGRASRPIAAANPTVDNDPIADLTSGYKRADGKVITQRT